MKNLLYFFLSRNALKELGKYLVIMAIGILMVGMLVIDVIGQELSPGILHKFTGEKSRFEIDISRTNNYSIIEDWENKVIAVVLPGLSFNKEIYDAKNNLKGYLIDKSDLQYSDGNTRLLITTKADFKINTFKQNNNKLLILDVYFAVAKPGFRELINRGSAYENRQEYSKALRQYQRAQDLRPQDNNVRSKIDNTINVIANADARKAPGTNSVDKNNTGQDIDVRDIENLDDTIQPPLNNQNENGNTIADLISENLINDPSINSETEIQVLSSQQLKSDESKSQGTAENFSSGSQIIPQIEILEDIPGDTGMMIGFQDLLKKSGTEIYVLIVMYSIVAALIFVVVLLARRLFKLHKKSNKQKTKIAGFLGSKGLYKNMKLTKGKKLVSDKHVSEVRKFAKQLSDLYSKTEPRTSGTKLYGDGHKSKQIIQDHTRKIDSVMKHIDKSSYDSESIRLTKRYRENNIRQNSTNDKYDAVRQLSEQNWEIWEIARELSMGTEEVKMALGMTESKDVEVGNDKLYEKIYLLSDKSISPSQIATALHISEEEIRLALKLREKQGIFV